MTVTCLEVALHRGSGHARGGRRHRPSQPRRLGTLGLTTFVKGEKNSPSETPSAAKMVASASTVTPLSPRSSLPR